MGRFYCSMGASRELVTGEITMPGCGIPQGDSPVYLVAAGGSPRALKW
ncbi:MAG TPA: hypothetical protein V6D22_14665 [Candidatus Obscuribacterales bacterium]